jgi:hypothetical protein
MSSSEKGIGQIFGGFFSSSVLQAFIAQKEHFNS